jgi:hypothetical protein
MIPEEFLARARDPMAWMAKAISLRRSADAVWDAFSEVLMASIDKESKSFNEEGIQDATNILRNCQLLYSLAAECALKGLIIQQCPTDVVFETTVDGTGALLDAKIKQIGKIRIDTHNLEKLAEISGAVGANGNADLRELLAFSTFCINWIGRYPVPLDTNSDFMPRGQLPAVVFNHYYRDLMDPFLDGILARFSR